jgi:hypothetical protein
MKNKDHFIMWENIIHIQMEKLQSKDTFVFWGKKSTFKEKT